MRVDETNCDEKDARTSTTGLPPQAGEVRQFPNWAHRRANMTEQFQKYQKGPRQPQLQWRDDRDQTDAAYPSWCGFCNRIRQGHTTSLSQVSVGGGF